MKGAKFTAAKQAAQAFLDTVPADLYVGIVTFAGERDRRPGAHPGPGRRLQPSSTACSCPTAPCSTTASRRPSPSAARTAAQHHRALRRPGHLRRRPRPSVTAAHQEGRRQGRRRRPRPVRRPTRRCSSRSSDAGKGTVISERDPAALGQVFAAEADVLAKQILITAPASGRRHHRGHPGGLRRRRRRVLHRRGLRHPARVRRPPAASPTDLRPPRRHHGRPAPSMLVGLGALGVGALVLLSCWSAALTTSRRESVESRDRRRTPAPAAPAASASRPDAPAAGSDRPGRRHRDQGAEEQPWLRGQAGRPARRRGHVPQAGRVAADARRHRLRRHGPDADSDRRQPAPQPGRPAARDRRPVGLPRHEALAAAQGVQLPARRHACS